MTEAHHPNPALAGFRMPPEWAPQAATWISWPADDDLWEGFLADVRAEYAELVGALTLGQDVCINVGSDEAEADARIRLHEAGVATERLRFHRVPLDDAWLRDNGPIFVRDGAGRVAATDWRFNAWGGKYQSDRDDRVPAAIAASLGMRRFAFDAVLEGGAIDVDDEGTLLTTRSCLLTPTRNPTLGIDGHEALLRAGLGATRIVWLPGGMAGDHTDGHVDTIARFTGPRTIVAAVAPVGHVDHAMLAANGAILRALRSADGAAYRVVDLPLPETPPMLGERRLAASYANFVIANGVVVVPTYGDPHDALALEILTPLFPERRVVGVSAQALITGGGAWHCVTQQQPAGEIADA
jgi:agmatine deiminase